MHITRAADYAVRVMIYLAGLPRDARVPRPEIARATATPNSFLAKVLQQLVQAGLIHSRRGSGGGFRLALDSSSISLLDVIEAIEGPTRLNSCLEPDPSCDRKNRCAAHEVWIEAQSVLVGVLSGASLNKLASRSAQLSMSGATSTDSVSLCGIAGGAVDSDRF